MNDCTAHNMDYSLRLRCHLEQVSVANASKDLLARMLPGTQSEHPCDRGTDQLSRSFGMMTVGLSLLSHYRITRWILEVYPLRRGRFFDALRLLRMTFGSDGVPVRRYANNYCLVPLYSRHSIVRSSNCSALPTKEETAFLTDSRMAPGSLSVAVFRAWIIRSVPNIC